MNQRNPSPQRRPPPRDRKSHEGMLSSGAMGHIVCIMDAFFLLRSGRKADLLRQLPFKERGNQHRQRLRDELAAEDDAAPSDDDFWHERSVEELASLQGVAAPKTLNDVLGKGDDLWEDGADFESFVHGIYERRR